MTRKKPYYPKVGDEIYFRAEKLSGKVVRTGTITYKNRDGTYHIHVSSGFTYVGVKRKDILGKRPKPRFAVLTFTLADGFVNTWTTYDDAGNKNPSTYETREQAQTALDTYLAEQKQAVKDGDMAEEYDDDDFKIVEVEGDE